MNWLRQHIVDDVNSFRSFWRRNSVKLAAVIALLSSLAIQQQSLIVNLLGQLPQNNWLRVPIALVTFALVFGVPTLTVLWKQPPSA